MICPLRIGLFLMMLVGQGEVGTPESAVVLEDYAPCGLTGLYLVCRIRDVPASWPQVKQAVGPAGAGGELSFAEMATAAETLGLHPVGMEVGRQALNDLPMPAIVQVHDSRFPEELPHFVVLMRPESDGVWLLDAPFPAYFLPEDRFQQSWTRKVLVFADSAEQADRIRRFASRSKLASSAAFVLLGAGILILAYAAIKWLSSSKTANIKIFLATVDYFRNRLAKLPSGRVLWGSLILLFFIAGVASVLFTRKNHSPPQCFFDEQAVELGELETGGKKTSVSLHNKGDEPLQIIAIQSSCSCAIVKHADTVNPHETATIDVDLNVAPGPGGANLTVTSNDPTGPKHVSLRWHGKTQPFLNPRWVAESKARLDQPYERTIRLLYPGGKSALVPHLEGFECDDRSVHIRAGANNPVATKFAVSGLLTKILGELELHLSVKPPATPTALFSVCFLHLKYGEDHLKLRLPILVDFSGGELTPSATVITFSAANQKDLLSQVRTVRITDLLPGTDIRVLDLPSWLSCQIERQVDKGFLLRFKMLNAPPAILIQRTLVISRKESPQAAIVLRLNVLAPS